MVSNNKIFVHVYILSFQNILYIVIITFGAQNRSKNVFNVPVKANYDNWYKIIYETAIRSILEIMYNSIYKVTVSNIKLEEKKNKWNHNIINIIRFMINKFKVFKEDISN